VIDAVEVLLPVRVLLDLVDRRRVEHGVRWIVGVAGDLVHPLAVHVVHPLLHLLDHLEPLREQSAPLLLGLDALLALQQARDFRLADRLPEPVSQDAVLAHRALEHLSRMLRVPGLDIDPSKQTHPVGDACSVLGFFEELDRLIATRRELRAINLWTDSP